MTLVEFLLARIADDAGIAESVSPPPWHAVDADDEAYIISQDFGEQVAVTDHLNVDHIMQWDPARVLAECEAKRRLITEVHCAHPFGHPDNCNSCSYYSEHEVALEECPTLRLLAQPFSDHPDYDKAWAVA
jgi:hypothetical protein